MSNLPMRTITLRAVREAGPVWSCGVHVSNEFDELHEWLGMSRRLYDDVMTWYSQFVAGAIDATATEARRRELLTALQDDLAGRVAVDFGVSASPDVLHLRDLRLGPDDMHVTIGSHVLKRPGAVSSASFERDVTRWLDLDKRSSEADLPDRLTFAMQDLGRRLANAVNESAGPDIRVVPW